MTGHPGVLRGRSGSFGTAALRSNLVREVARGVGRRMAVTVRETERKYDLDEDAALPPWPEPADAAGSQEFVLEAIYFDTADLRLAADGVTLRRRRGGADSGWHLKLPVAADCRDEIRVGFTRGEAGRRSPQPPDELVRLVHGFTRGRPLVPVAELTTRRRQWRLTDDSGRGLVTVVDDHVTAHTMGVSTEARSWREVEVELDEAGDTRLLDRFDRRLRKAGVRRSEAPSKLARVLGDRIPAARRPGPDRSATLGAVVLAYLAEQARVIRTGDPAVRREVPDAVHRMRVATRRMRSALQAFGAVVDRDATGDLAAELKWLAAVLGVARDLEVLEARILAAVAALPDELVLGPVAAQVTRYFTGRRVLARDEVLAALDGERYLALLTAIDRLLDTPPLTPAAGRRARPRLGAFLDRSHRRVDTHLRAAERRGPDVERDIQLHDARKAAKRLRYAAEAAAPVLGEPARALIRQVRQVQELLGERQDAIVALPVLRELGAAAALEGGNGFTFGVLHQQEHQALTATTWTPVRRALGRAARGATAR